jgi:hypothetical protein
MLTEWSDVVAAVLMEEWESEDFCFGLLRCGRFAANSECEMLTAGIKSELRAGISTTSLLCLTHSSLLKTSFSFRSNMFSSQFM